MLYGLWLSAAGLQVNQHKQAVIANNLANVDTVGFKRDLATFQERRIERETATGGMRFRHPLLDGLTGGTWQNPTTTDFTQAALQDGGLLDCAVDGDGFFTVRVGDQTRYTRDGRFTLNENGDLVTVTGGHAVLDQAGQPIHIGRAPSDSIGINTAGHIMIGQRQVASLGLVDFTDRSRLVKAGGNTFDGSFAEQTEAKGQVRQGRIESSGVESTTELVQMIEASRLYQLNATMISFQDGMLGRAANDVGRVA
ncbi:MAG: flagellar hook-basal body protein [Phycisphaerae bacterium]|nr:flagellar hook-basal body protein [Phycisphaerae bacterium]